MPGTRGAQSGGRCLAGREPPRALAQLLARLETLGVGLRIAAAPADASAAPPGRPASAEAAHRVLRRLLSNRAQGRIPADRWVLAWSGSGRPLVRGPEIGFYASVAYTPCLFAVAVASGRRLGVDLELESVVPEKDLPLHLLAPAEIALVRANSSVFLTIWTLKEALAKERGEGLLVDCRTLDVAPYAGAEPCVLVPRADRGLACQARFRLGDEAYRLALAIGPLEP